MRWRLLALIALLSACGLALEVRDFVGTEPALDPVAFFTGEVRSWGVLERFGRPVSVVITECSGTLEGDELRMTQVLRIGKEPPTTRQWQMRRIGSGRFEATADDMVGVAVGEAAGRAFHWNWTLALSPGNPLANVTMEQWWFLLDDGSLLNRTKVHKLGVTLAEVTEHFARR